jgi:16S rRNA (guanine966-N2)-methyltransferase
MRIIAGRRRGHKLEGPKNRSTRPTSDLIREAIFNILADSVEGKLAIDLFAGTGALGLEALSRGAAKARFIEQNRENAALIHRNLAALRYEDLGIVYHGDVFRMSNRIAELVDQTSAIIFIDPPYREYENHPGRVRKLIEALIPRLAPGSAIVVEFDEFRDDSLLPNPEQWDVRRYGGTRIGVFRSIDDPIDSADETEFVQNEHEDEDGDEPKATTAADRIGI